MTIKSHKARYFDIRELVPESIYLERGEEAWQLIDDRLITNLDSLKTQLEDLYGRKIPLIVNNWMWGGDRVCSGLRTPGQGCYNPQSQHAFGRAVDPICEIPAPDIREHIRQERIVLPYPASFEEFNGMGWVHMDMRNMSNGHTHFFHP